MPAPALLGIPALSTLLTWIGGLLGVIGAWLIRHAAAAIIAGLVMGLVQSGILLGLMVASLTGVDLLVQQLTSVVEQINTQLEGDWSAVGDIISKANTYFPIDHAVMLSGIVFGAWVVTLKIRAAIWVMRMVRRR